MKKTLALLFALVMALIVGATAESADLTGYIGSAYSGVDPWGGTLTVTVRDIRDGRMDWTFTDTLDGMTLTQDLEGTALSGDTAAFHVEGAAEVDHETFDYEGTIALRDGVVYVAYTRGELTEHSEEGGSTAYHVAALDETARVALLRPAPLTEAEAIDRFCDTWVADGAAVEIWYEDDAFHCRSTLNDDMAIDYERCRYDETEGMLSCEGGIRYTETFDEAKQALVTETIATDLTGSFELIDNGAKLIWNDSEGICKRFEFRRLTDAEEADWQEAQAFVGRWGQGRCTIDITEGETGDYHVNITWGSSASENVAWDYDCVYDGETKLLSSYAPGVKRVLTWNENGEIADTQVEYEDGEAAFSIDDEDRLRWDDKKENAAGDMRFERGVLPQP